MSQRIFLVDTDPGVDDCAALMMLMSQYSNVKIVGITCAAGNVGLHDVTVNAVRIVKLCGMLEEIPIFKGCEKPLLLTPTPIGDTLYHGNDGLGDVPDVYPERSDDLLTHVQAEHAANAIIRFSKEYQSQLQLVCLGPLTNIAVATKLDPDLPKRVKSIHILGGTSRGYGNVTPCAEYNFFTDPEAAYNVFRSFPQHCPTDVVTYETTLDHGVPPEMFNKMTSGSGQRQRFFREVSKKTLAYEQRNFDKGINTGYCLCDPYLMAVVLDPTVVKKAKHAKVTVEIGGCISRGSFIIDHRNKGSPHLSEATVRIVEELDNDIFQSLFSKAFEE